MMVVQFFTVLLFYPETKVERATTWCLLMYWERLFDVMGDGKYHDFALWFYKERSRNEVKWDANWM